MAAFGSKTPRFHFSQRYSLGGHSLGKRAQLQQRQLIERRKQAESAEKLVRLQECKNQKAVDKKVQFALNIAQAKIDNIVQNTNVARKRAYKQLDTLHQESHALKEKVSKSRFEHLQQLDKLRKLQSSTHALQSQFIALQSICTQLYEEENTGAEISHVNQHRLRGLVTLEAAIGKLQRFVATTTGRAESTQRALDSRSIEQGPKSRNLATYNKILRSTSAGTRDRNEIFALTRRMRMRESKSTEQDTRTANADTLAASLRRASVWLKQSA